MGVLAAATERSESQLLRAKLAKHAKRRDAKNSAMMEMGIVPTNGGAANHRRVVHVETRQNDSVPHANQPLAPF